MKKGIFSFLITVIFSFTFQARAQKADLYVKSADKGLYVEHKVMPKESFFSIGRLYNVHPRHLATYNKIDMNKGLLIDQRLHIPLTDTNFTQKGNSGTPVYFKPADAVTLSAVSRENNNVAVSSLKSWNALSGDQVKKDSKLIIGFLLSKEMPSVTIKPKQAEATETKTEKIVTPAVVTEEKKEPVTPVEKPVPPQEIKLPEVKQPEIKQPERKEEKPVVTAPENTSGNDQGYFKYSFDQQVRKSPVSKEETVTSGIFKTASGWQDEKYYMLIDGVAPGTIIKISNPSNTRVIYAKVLGEMNGIRQNEGYSIRISNAAASKLAISDTEKFIVKIIY